MLYFKVQGYQRVEYTNKQKDNFIMFDVVDLFVFAKSEKEAIKKARAIVKRKFYRIARVDEHIHTDPWAYFPWDKVKKLLK